MSRQRQKKILLQQSSVFRNLAKNKAKTNFIVTKFNYVATDLTFLQSSHSAGFFVTKFCHVLIEFTLSQQSHSVNFVKKIFCHFATDFTWSQQIHSADYVTTKFCYVAIDFTLSQQSYSANVVATKFYYVTTKIMTKTETLSGHNQVQLCCDKVLLCREKDHYVATNLQYVATLMMENPEKPKN